MSIQITFLNHSGFAVETDSKVLIFDYYKDPSGTVAAYEKAGKKPLWFFVSHWHEDHFNRGIGAFGGAQYIVNEDVALQGVPGDRLHVMKVYDTLDLGGTKVTQYGSTDEGGSSLVETDGLRIFHAGDLNWWHWLGDTDENNAEAKGNFEREMKHLAGQTFDIAFFPVDARLEGAREWGVKGFLADVSVTQCLIPMHYFGTPWTPSADFKAAYPDVPLWIPLHDGDATRLGGQ